MVIPPPTLPPCLAQVHDDRFHLGVLIDPLVASLAPETGFLEPPARDLVGVAGGIVGHDELVHEAHGQPAVASTTTQFAHGGARVPSVRSGPTCAAGSKPDPTFNPFTASTNAGTKRSAIDRWT